MRSIYKQWPLPKGIKDFIWNNTDFQFYQTQKISRYVSCIEMYDGMPIKRVFGFVSRSQFRTYEDIKVKEVARFYKHKMYLGYVECNIMTGQKKVYYDAHPDRFDLYKGNWFFDTYDMTDPDEFLKEHNLMYTGWNEGKGNGIGFHEYLTRYLENPKVELLSKAGLGYWIQYMRYLDTSKKSLHEIFKIKPECVRLLTNPGLTFRELMACRRTGYTDYKKIAMRVSLDSKRDAMLREYNQQFHKDDRIIQVLKKDKTVEYCIRLKEANYWFIHDYIDYLKDLVLIGAITDEKMLYPEHFQEAHVEVAKKIETAQSQILIEGFLKQYAEHQKYSWSQGEYLIRPVKEPKELYTESDILHHCVRTYDKNVAAGTTEIMFIRTKKQEDVPYYTLELKNKKVIQVRGDHNANPSEEIQRFVTNWAKRYKIQYEAQQVTYRYY